jgi:hypothetical protein
MGDIADDLIQDGIDYMIEERASLKEICNVLEDKKTKGGKSMNRTFYIAGVQFRPKEDINKNMKCIEVGDILELIPEPENKFDPNAVKICYEDLENPDIIHLGYVPKKFSAEVAALLEADIYLECIVEEINPAAKPWEVCKVIIRDTQ